MSEAVNQIVDQVVNQNVVSDASQILETEQKPVETKPEPTVDPRISGKLEVLIRREQAAVHRERAAKALEAEVQAKLARIEEFENSKADPRKALGLLGLSYDELTQSMLNDGHVPPEVEIKKVRDEIENMKKASEAEKERIRLDAERAAEAREKKAIEDFKSEISTYLSDNKDRYELIAFEGQQALVFEVIDEQFNRTKDPETGAGKVMSIAEASDRVEKWLEEKYDKSRNLNKVKTLWGAVPKVGANEAAKPKQTFSQTPKTLTNNLNATPTKPRTQPMSDDERVQRAIAYAKSLRG